MYSPFVPHITEYIYQNIYKNICKEPLLSCNKYKELPCDNKYLEFGDFIKKMISEVRKFKSSRNMSIKDRIDNIKINTSLNNAKLLKDSIIDILSCTSANNIDVEINNDDFDIEITPVSNDKVLRKL